MELFGRKAHAFRYGGPVRSGGRDNRRKRKIKRKRKDREGG
jgi:hypothetical protein